MAQSITIKIAEHTYSLKVSSPEQEEVIRKAADDINRKIALYQEKFPTKSMVDVLSFMALNVCIANITLQKQMKEMQGAEEALAKELEGYLDNIDKNSR
ncbi:MAG: cell division protein ZapA [Bacteroidales bacterium]|nr:cell division protein ZapA [Bacteroidales bacterium]MBQ9722151.1 cell division protein ZapA [Bacteroidales bacterium]